MRWNTVSIADQSSRWPEFALFVGLRPGVLLLPRNLGAEWLITTTSAPALRA